LTHVPDDDAAVEVIGLTKVFGREVRAVDDVSFRVAPGEVCGLLGPNGAGKTTTLRILAGLVRPSSGSARILGTTVTPGNAVLGRVGTMIEHASFVPYLTGRRNLACYWEAGGGDLATANLDEALSIAGLGSAIDRKVKTYSQGMRQRLGIARALLGRPQVLLLDEPTNGLDPGEMREVRSLLARLASEGTPILLSSHLLSEVEQICSHVVVMDRGALVADGTVAALTRSSSVAYLEVDDEPRAREVLATQTGVRAVHDEPPGLVVELDGMTRAEVTAALVGAGVGVETITARRRLEDAFLGLLEHDR
jgi:ABC-2 type transport system ATP-binding protein